MDRYLALILACIVVVGSSAAKATIIADTFAPGDGTLATGVTVGTTPSFGTREFRSAAPFVMSQPGTVTNVTVKIHGIPYGTSFQTRFNGSLITLYGAVLTLSVLADDGGLPGAFVGDLGNISGDGIVSLNTSFDLAAGAYWLRMMQYLPDPPTFVDTGWYFNSIGARGRARAFESPYISGAESWSIPTGVFDSGEVAGLPQDISPAYRISARLQVPEPSSLIMTGTCFLLLFVTRRRRTRGLEDYHHSRGQWLADARLLDGPIPSAGSGSGHDKKVRDGRSGGGGIIWRPSSSEP